MPPDLPVAGYFRVSQARDDMKAPEFYQADIDRYCELRHFELAETFSDIDFSAFRGAKTRPALEELKRRRKEFSAVIVPKLSRFGRSVKDLISLFELFETDGVALIFLDMGLDTSTSQGRLLRHILAAFAEYESDVRGDYFRAAQDARARKGLPPMGWIAFGYRRVKGTYEISKPEAEVVRAIFNRYEAGESMLAITRWLNDEGITSPRGLSWGKPTVRNFLDNHHYAGLLVHEGALHEGSWDPIVPKALWGSVQDRRRAVTNRGVCVRRGIYLLSGMITCGVCGTTLTHRTKQDRVPGQYVCRGIENTGSCTGGGIADHRAHELVTTAYMKRFGNSLVHDPSSPGVPLPTRVYWERADREQRRTILRVALDRIVLIPRPGDNRRGRGMVRGRDIEITWAVAESHDLDRSRLMKAYFAEWRQVQDRMRETTSISAGDA
jgi:site-specific DNA recombinase